MSCRSLQLRILRQLVELQLCHSFEIKRTIDRAWGVVHNKHKKAETTPSRPPPEDPQSQENLQLVPLGQDTQRKRYWVIDSEYTLNFSLPFLCRICAYLPCHLELLKHKLGILRFSSWFRRCIRG